MFLDNLIVSEDVLFERYLKENYNTFYKLHQANIMLSENSFSLLSEAVKRDIKAETSKFVNGAEDLIKNRDKYEKAVGRDKFLSRLFLFVNLGCFILGLIVPSIRIVTLLIQMISLILQIYFQSKEIVDKNKLMNIKAKITRLKKKHSNNPAVAKQLDGCLAKLNKVA